MRFVFTCFLFLDLGSSAISEIRGPNKPVTATSYNNQKSDEADKPAYRFPAWPSAQPAPRVINIFTAKHSGDVSECSGYKDWKNWGTFVWCRFWEWVDAERVIAIFTIILGIATWLLWRSTDKLVIGAENMSKRQLRALYFRHCSKNAKDWP